jgi:hypothetical protein
MLVQHVFLLVQVFNMSFWIYEVHMQKCMLTIIETTVIQDNGVPFCWSGNFSC